MPRLLRLALLIGLLLPGAAQADERPALKLLRPDSLLGWGYGAEGTQGWQIERGTLVGAVDAAPLVSGFTFGAFELAFEWSVADDSAALGVSLPPDPRGALAEGDVRLIFSAKEARTVFTTESKGQEQKQYHRLATNNVEPQTFHPATIRYDGGTLRIESHGGTAIIKVPAGLRFGLVLNTSGGEARLRGLQLREPAGESIFSGENLDGWWTPGNKNAWHAEQGELVKRGRGGNYLRTEKEFGNFTFSLQYLIEQGDNSGIGIRTGRSGWPSSEGMELQLQNSPGLNKHALMAIYGNVPPAARADQPHEWNHVTIKADGPMISAWINGELVQHSNTARHPELKHRRPAGWIGFQDHGGIDRFRNLRVLEHAAGQGPSVWQQFEPTAAEVVVNRLMNPEQVAVQDGLRSQAVTAEATGSEQQVLAELAGPGAVVRIVPPNHAGKLAFYFDGEEKPRIERNVEDLLGIAPRIAEDDQPLLTYLPYTKSLKIVLHDGKPGEYWIDAVRVPDDLPIESYTGDETLPRGWEPALEYRRHHQRYGTLRYLGPYERASTTQQMLAAGSSLPLVSIDGTGLVEWLHLEGANDLLHTDDLWLEVRVDGEEKPSVAAPARYLFAPVHDRHRHANYLISARDPGFASRIAIPFERGLTITARNRGAKPIAGLDLTASYRPAHEEATKRQYEKMLRLRGHFEQGENLGSVRLDGHGRLVALVQQHKNLDASRSARIDRLTVDGQPQPAWVQASYERFLGASDGMGDFRTHLSGRAGGFSWRYLQLAPVEYEDALELRFDGPTPQSRLVLYYADPAE